MEKVVSELTTETIAHVYVSINKVFTFLCFLFYHLESYKNMNSKVDI